VSEAPFSVDGVIGAMRAQPPKSAGGGRAIMVIAARRGEGASTVARAVAGAAGPGTVYAIDLDLRRNALARAFALDSPPLGPRIDGRLNGAAFHQIVTESGVPCAESVPAFSYHRIGRLYVGAFDARALPQGGRVLISAASDYWRAARAGGGTVVVDAPALERSAIGLRIARHMDGIVLVVGADAGAAPAAMAARTEILAAGGTLLGLVYTNASGPVMALDRLLAQAG
jgi:Mrp family chromosome partitioning ATPase